MTDNPPTAMNLYREGGNVQTSLYAFPHYAGRRARIARIRRATIAYQRGLRRQWARADRRELAAIREREEARRAA